MASTFDRKVSTPGTTLADATNLGDSAVVQVPPGKQWVLIGWIYTNKSTSANYLLEAALLRSGGVAGADEDFQVRDFSLPKGSKINLLPNGERMILKAGDRIRHKFGSATDGRMILSYLERAA